MEFKGDISGLNELEEQIENTYFNKLIEIGRDAIRVAYNASGSSKYPKVYKNHTWRLRKAPGFCVVRDGKIVALEVYGKGTNMEAVQKTTYYCSITKRKMTGFTWLTAWSMQVLYNQRVLMLWTPQFFMQKG